VSRILAGVGERVIVRGCCKDGLSMVLDLPLDVVDTHLCSCCFERLRIDKRRESLCCSCESWKSACCNEASGSEEKVGGCQNAGGVRVTL